MKNVILRSVPEGFELHKYYYLLPDIVARFDREYRHLFVNRTIEAVTGRKREEFLGKTNAELGMPAELVNVWHGLLGNIVKSKTKLEADFEFPAQDGVRFYHMVGNPEFDAEGEVVSVFVITRDLTEKKKIQEKLIQSVKQSSYQSVLSEFTHHLNNPLSVVSARLELLNRKKEEIRSAGIQDQIESIQMEIHRMRDLVTAMTKSTSSLAAYDIPQYSMMVSELIDAVLQMYGAQSQSASVEILKECAEDILIESGCGELVEAIGELVKNAMESSKAQSNPKVWIQSETSASDLKIEIIDSGSEVPFDLREKIFDPFFTTKGPAHRGLGLAIVKSRLQRLGGEVNYRRENGKNHFQILLPSFFVSSARSNISES